MMNRFLSFMACPFAGRQTKAARLPFYFFRVAESRGNGENMEKKKEKTINLNVLVPLKLHKSFKKACVDRGVTIKAVIVKAMEDFTGDAP